MVVTEDNNIDHANRIEREHPTKHKERDWWKKSVFYQIYPRSFLDSNADGIGDIAGIRKKLDYLQLLGVDALWISPIFPSPNKDFGYDIQDYCAIDPTFGTLKEFDGLIDDVHKRGMYIVMDGVFNHTSDQHPWFQSSLKKEDKRDWYIWSQTPNNWTSAFGGSAWTYAPTRKKWYLHSFAKEQPDLNWDNPAVEEAILSIMEFWYQRGIDGFRLDVFNCYHKKTGLPDNPKRWDWQGLIGGRFYSYINQEHIHDRDQPELMGCLKRMRALADRYNAVLIGETLDERLRYDNAAQYVGENKLHLAFHFQLLHTRWNPIKMTQACRELQRCFATTWPNIVLSNHDFPRQSKRWGAAEERRKIMAFLSLTQKGTPFIYYGEEIAMQESTLPRKQILDPVGKRFWPFFSGRDGCRTPMQWDESPFGGFSAFEPWLPVHRDYRKRNVALQQRAPLSVWNTYRTLLQLRRQHSALHSGDQQWIASPSACLFYRRKTPEESLVCLLNLGNQSVEIPNVAGKILYHTHPDSSNLLRPYEGIIIKES
ncbi:MAG: alpha-glucosidase [Myxococcota bacterium]|nr:alpha-glucosidase [Myxococcota bacterium]